jgi:predicted nuclease of restriction endonuclease-like (RecB) superfamily
MVKKENDALVATPSVENRFYEEVSAILREGRGKARIAVNYAMVETYWRIGRRIVEQEQKGKERANYGDYLLTNLSRHLGVTFGKGFSYANLRNFRQFYLTFPDANEFATHCVANLGWTHIRLIMRLENAAERNYYLKEASEQNWSSRVLERNIKSGYYRRLLSTQIAPPEEKTPAPLLSDFIKDPYVLEFLGIPEDGNAYESTVESVIVSHLQQFLMELGKGFSFVGRQFRVSTETSHFYIDLVFYNYLLKCFVVIDLKTTKLTHQDIGQKDMYVRMFDELKRGVDDNPTIGIILCADKDETIVKYSMLKESRQIFASKYRQVLPTEDELATELARNVKMLRKDDKE